MSLLVVGSVALDTVETPFGRAEDALGGSATFFSAAASLLHPVQLVGVIGDDYPVDALNFLAERNVDLAGLERAKGESFRWSGVYSHDLNSRETLETRLGVFADFSPKIPDQFRDAEWVFLGNIDPELQIGVLDQVHKPRFVACDTMNLWIEIKRQRLVELLGRVDLLMVNDGEARQLSGQHNLSKAARWILDRGPRYLIIKKGEHGAILFTPTSTFFAPGYPLEDVFDPTGAGDAFAGGFMAHLAQSGRLDDADLRRAVVYGSVLGSYAVEKFSVERFKDLTAEEIEERVRHFREMTGFELPVSAGV
ncbi:PfkB family carbohydrate kinase [Longimicrobium sp.]|jgi:sugar/nucleoside kinase (ribokinase family)|uniref:PfkB family carbohydrate kinase n=1 Tax=Longimicrobium sp. TaxID=2029185 RepID=UPI002F93B4FD